jgi:hypothetical protein
VAALPTMPSSPAVMLSPNARNRVTAIFGGASTVTANVQLLVRCPASVEAQETVVVPIANVDGLGGTQLVVTGTVPPVTVGV